MAAKSWYSGFAQAFSRVSGQPIALAGALALISRTQGAHETLLDLEELEDQELMQLRDRYLEMAGKAREQRRSRLATSGEAR